MSPQSSAPVQRTAPIAIAPKPPRPEPSPYRQDSFHRLEMGHGVASSAPVEGSSFNASSIPPCLSCRYSRVNCILNDDDDGCIQCQAAGSECSLSSSPQSRKRKLHGEASDDIIGKRRLDPHVYPHIHLHAEESSTLNPGLTAPPVPVPFPCVYHSLLHCVLPFDNLHITRVFSTLHDFV